MTAEKIRGIHSPFTRVGYFLLGIMIHCLHLRNAGQQDGSDYYHSAAENNSRFVDTPRVGTELRVAEEALSNLPLRANSPLPNNPTSSGIRLRDSLDQSAGNIISASHSELPSGNSLFSMNKRRKRRSTEDERGDTTACDICQRRNVHVSLYTRI